jgi:hypothetical protein
MDKLKLVKKVFNKGQGEEFLKIHRPELFGKTQRAKKIKYLGDDIWTDISKINIEHIKSYTRDYSINNEDGKYYHINCNPEYHKNLINRSKIDKKDSPCHPENFSESVVKPCIRTFIKKKMNPDDIETYIKNQLVDKLVKHAAERINQQVKADWSEYLILKHCPDVFPTLKHTKGTDMYLVKVDGEIEDLDIKTTRSIWEIEDKKEAIKKLYEGQGKDRFSDNPRLYIYLSDKELCESENIVKQMNEKYDIDFTYEKKDYKVNGCRLIII